MRFAPWPLVAASLVAAPAFGITVNVTDFVYPGADTVSVFGGSTAPSYTGQAGEFVGTLTDSTATLSSPFTSLASASPDAGSSTPFRAWCADLSQSFSFGVDYTYDVDPGLSVYGSAKYTALSELFTAAAGFVVDKTTSAAMQAAIWEILYETSGSYDLTSGNFTGVPQSASGQAAFNQVNSFLTHLSSYGANYTITVLGSDTNQDFLIATVPEPSTWALFAVGIAMSMTMAKRRRERS